MKMELKDTTESKQGRVIELIEVSSEKTTEKDTKTILIIGVFHGDEPQGEYLIRKFLAEEQGRIKNKLLMIPCLNPDGKALNTRQNSNGIDLNRNFPTSNRKIIEDKQYYGGEKPASEIETQFLIEVIEKNKPDFILSLHTPYKVVNYDGPAKTESKKISEITGYPVEEYIGYETPGSFGTYAGKERNIPTVTLELAEDEDDETLWKNIKGVFEYCAKEL